MAKLPKAVSSLIESFEQLPGIGPKTAARLTFYLLRLPQQQLEKFSQAVSNLKKNTVTCSVCFNISEKDPCLICGDSARFQNLLCVVENPIDILAIENTSFKGVYHVLGGAIDPLNNIGPDEIRISELIERIKKGSFSEIILATNPSMEGEATAMYIKNEIINLKKQIPLLSSLKLTRLAYGLPIGADVEFADALTLSKAIEGRREA